VLFQLQASLRFFRFKLSYSVWLNTLVLGLSLLRFETFDATLLANFISSVINRGTAHSSFLLFLKKLFKILRRVFYFKGLKVLLTGKVDGLRRAHFLRLIVGLVSKQSLAVPASYSFSTSFTCKGVIGIKVWFFPEC
jgi:ribosomal protein S3